MRREVIHKLVLLIWTAPAKRSGDGAFDWGGVFDYPIPKRCRATLATAVQNLADSEWFMGKACVRANEPHVPAWIQNAQISGGGYNP
jgi:hypothetical protein